MQLNTPSNFAILPQGVNGISWCSKNAFQLRFEHLLTELANSTIKFLDLPLEFAIRLNNCC